jgi:hypothetical protein
METKKTEKQIHKRNTPIKKRNQSAYNNKVKTITDWYNRLVAFREKFPRIINPNTKKETLRKPLKELEYYLNLLKKSKGEIQ